MFIACNNTEIQNDELVSIQKTEFKQLKSVSRIDGKYKIDTSIILTGKNKQILTDLYSENLMDIKTMEEIPTFIKDFLDSISYNKDFSIANPNEDWQAGCTTIILIDKKGKKISKKLATHQLVYFGLGDSTALFTYYTGGNGKSKHIIVLKYNDENIIDFWFENNIFFDFTKEELLVYLKRKLN